MTDQHDNRSLPSDGKPNMEDFWAFRTMLTPVLVQVIFWVGVLGCIGYGIFQILPPQRGAVTPGPMEIIRGIAWIVFGPLAVRLVCEVAILFFRMNETLTEIRNKLK